MTMPAANSAVNSSAAPPKKHRQTRIPEHLKAVKKGSSSSSASSSSSSSSALKSSLAKALRAASTLKKSEHASAAAASSTEDNGPAKAMIQSDAAFRAHAPLTSPVYAFQAPARSSTALATPSSTPVTSPQSATAARPTAGTRTSIQSANGAAQASSPASGRLPYALTNDRTNELAASLDRSASYSSLQSVPIHQQQQQRPAAHSRPSTSTSTMALDSTLLARSCSSASSMAYSQPEFTFSTGPTSQSLSSTSSAFTQPSFDSSSSTYGHVQLPVWPSPSSNNSHMGYVQSPTGMLTSRTYTSSISMQQQQQPVCYEAFNKTTPTRSKRSQTSVSNISGSSSASSIAVTPGRSVPLSSSSMSTSTTWNGSSPMSSNAALSASLILSISSDGKARLTTPQNNKKRGTPVKSNTPKALVAAAMLRSSTTANVVKTPLRPAMMRSNTTDPRMSNARKQEVSEVNGIGRVVGQGKVLDLHEIQKYGMSFANDNNNIAAIPQPLNLDIEMDLAAGMGLPGYPTSYSQVSYPYLAYTTSGAILTPPQSAEMGKQLFPNIGSNTKVQPTYPEKERFQSSWKFPAGMGLNLHTSGQSVPGSVSGGTASSSPSSVITSSFPSMHSLNASIVNVMNVNNAQLNSLASSPVVRSPVEAVSQDMSRRQSRIQAWLDSPDLQDEEDISPSWSSLPSRHEDADSTSAPPTASSSGGFSISPASIMTRTMSEIQHPSAATDEEYEEIEVMRASGKSIRPLKISKKRRLLGHDDEEKKDGLSTKDKTAIKAGLGMPFQAMASSRPGSPSNDGASPGKRVRSNNNNEDPMGANGRKGRRTKKKGSNICSCGTGDDGKAMILCDECAHWFHLACVGVDEDDIPERWLCTPCVNGSAMDQNVNTAQAAYASPSSLMLHDQLNPSPAIQQTPKRPGLTREPTFSKTATPKLDSQRQFDDAPLVAQSSGRPIAIPSTPQANTVQYTPSHSHVGSLSRAYAPVTPRIGSAGHTSAPGTQYQWDTYSPHTPGNAIAHSRRLSRQHQQLNTPLSTWSHPTQWEDLPSSVPRRSANESARTQQWEQFYNAPPPASINPIPMTPPLASHSAFAASESFLPPFEQEASVSQRFLAIHSTPSQWTDTARFANNVW